jgi:hypothetical protein
MNMAYLLGQFVGGLIIIYLLSVFVEWALVKRILDTPTVGIVVSTLAATVLAIILYGFGNADGGPWTPMPGAMIYIVSGAVVTVGRLLSRRRYDEKNARAGAADAVQ